jgi:hypothetical protein
MVLFAEKGGWRACSACSFLHALTFRVPNIFDSLHRHEFAAGIVTMACYSARLGSRFLSDRPLRVGEGYDACKGPYSYESHLFHLSS